jgi:hypothetical protein
LRLKGFGNTQAACLKTVQRICDDHRFTKGYH